MEKKQSHKAPQLKTADQKAHSNAHKALKTLSAYGRKLPASLASMDSRVQAIPTDPSDNLTTLLQQSIPLLRKLYKGCTLPSPIQIPQQLVDLIHSDQIIATQDQPTALSNLELIYRQLAPKQITNPLFQSLVVFTQMLSVIESLRTTTNNPLGNDMSHLLAFSMPFFFDKRHTIDHDRMLDYLDIFSTADIFIERDIETTQKTIQDAKAKALLQGKSLDPRSLKAATDYVTGLTPHRITTFHIKRYLESFHRIFQAQTLNELIAPTTQIDADSLLHDTDHIGDTTTLAKTRKFTSVEIPITDSRFLSEDISITISTADTDITQRYPNEREASIAAMGDIKIPSVHQGVHGQPLPFFINTKNELYIGDANEGYWTHIGGSPDRFQVIRFLILNIFNQLNTTRLVIKGIGPHQPSQPDQNELVAVTDHLHQEESRIAPRIIPIVPNGQDLLDRVHTIITQHQSGVIPTTGMKPRTHEKIASGPTTDSIYLLPAGHRPSIENYTTGIKRGLRLYIIVIAPPNTNNNEQSDDGDILSVLDITHLQHEQLLQHAQQLENDYPDYTVRIYNARRQKQRTQT